ANAADRSALAIELTVRHGAAGHGRQSPDDRESADKRQQQAQNRQAASACCRWRRRLGEERLVAVRAGDCLACELVVNFQLGAAGAGQGNRHDAYLIRTAVTTERPRPTFAAAWASHAAVRPAASSDSSANT